MSETCNVNDLGDVNIRFIGKAECTEGRAISLFCCMETKYDELKSCSSSLDCKLHWSEIVIGEILSSIC